MSASQLKIDAANKVGVTKLINILFCCCLRSVFAGLSNAVGRMSDSRARGPKFECRLKYCLKGPLNPKQPTNQPKFNTRFGHIFFFLLQLVQEGQLSVTGGSVCTKYLLNA